MKTLDEVSRELRAEFKALREEIQALREARVVPELLSFKAAAERLSCSTSTVKRMVATGEVITVMIAKTPKIPASELRRLAQPPAPRSAVTHQVPRKSAMTEAEKMRARLKRR